MDLRQLRCFVALAQEKHFQRAARNVNLTQPALSYQLKTLEEKLGVTLIERDRRNVSLTEAGEYLLTEGKTLLQKLEDIVAETKSIGGQKRQSLTIGFNNYLNLDVIARSIMLTSRQHPNIDIHQEEISSNQVFDAVKEGEIDLGFAPLPATHPTLKVKPIVKGNWVAVVPKQHALASENKVSLSQLADESLILFDRRMNPVLYDWWMANFDKQGIIPNIALQTRQVATGIKMVADGLAIFLAASYILNELPDSVVQKPIELDNDQIQIGAVWHIDNKSPALQKYLESLREISD